MINPTYQKILEINGDINGFAKIIQVENGGETYDIVMEKSGRFFVFKYEDLFSSYVDVDPETANNILNEFYKTDAYKSLQMAKNEENDLNRVNTHFKNSPDGQEKKVISYPEFLNIPNFVNSPIDYYYYHITSNNIYTSEIKDYPQNILNESDNTWINDEDKNPFVLIDLFTYDDIPYLIYFNPFLNIFTAKYFDNQKQKYTTFVGSDEIVSIANFRLANNIAVKLNDVQIQYRKLFYVLFKRDFASRGLREIYYHKNRRYISSYNSDPFIADDGNTYILLIDYKFNYKLLMLTPGSNIYQPVSDVDMTTKYKIVFDILNIEYDKVKENDINFNAVSVYPSIQSGSLNYTLNGQGEILKYSNTFRIGPSKYFIFSIQNSNNRYTILKLNNNSISLEDLSILEKQRILFQHLDGIKKLMNNLNMEIILEKTPKYINAKNYNNELIPMEVIEEFIVNGVQYVVVKDTAANVLYKYDLFGNLIEVSSNEFKIVSDEYRKNTFIVKTSFVNKLYYISDEFLFNITFERHQNKKVGIFRRIFGQGILVLYQNEDGTYSDVDSPTGVSLAMKYTTQTHNIENIEYIKDFDTNKDNFILWYTGGCSLTYGFRSQYFKNNVKIIKYDKEEFVDEVAIIISNIPPMDYLIVRNAFGNYRIGTPQEIEDIDYSNGYNFNSTLIELTDFDNFIIKTSGVGDSKFYEIRQHFNDLNDKYIEAVQTNTDVNSYFRYNSLTASYDQVFSNDIKAIFGRIQERISYSECSYQVISDNWNKDGEFTVRQISEDRKTTIYNVLTSFTNNSDTILILDNPGQPIMLYYSNSVVRPVMESDYAELIVNYYLKHSNKYSNGTLQTDNIHFKKGLLGRIVHRQVVELSFDDGSTETIKVTSTINQNGAILYYIKPIMGEPLLLREVGVKNLVKLDPLDFELNEPLDFNLNDTSRYDRKYFSFDVPFIPFDSKYLNLERTLYLHNVITYTLPEKGNDIRGYQINYIEKSINNLSPEQVPVETWFETSGVLILVIKGLTGLLPLKRNENSRGLQTLTPREFEAFVKGYTCYRLSYGNPLSQEAVNFVRIESDYSR